MKRPSGGEQGAQKKVEWKKATTRSQKRVCRERLANMSFEKLRNDVETHEMLWWLMSAPFETIAKRFELLKCYFELKDRVSIDTVEELNKGKSILIPLREVTGLPDCALEGIITFLQLQRSSERLALMK